MDMTKDFRKNLLSMIITGSARQMLTPVKIRKDGLVTIVFWKDGSATSVRCGAGETYDDYVAFCAALAKKLFLSQSNIKRVLKNTPVEIENPPILTADNKPATVGKVVGPDATFVTGSAFSPDINPPAINLL